MKNILSYEPGTLFSGKEIIEWAKYQIENRTSHYSQGNRVIRLYGATLNPVRMYEIKSSYESWGCGNLVHKPLVTRAGKELPSFWDFYER